MPTNEKPDLVLQEPQDANFKPISFTPIIRILGTVILIFGLWMAYQIFKECWGLYNDPSKITKFAQYVEEGSNIDHFASSFIEDTRRANREILENIRSKQGEGFPQNTKELPPLEKPRFSYFASWFIVFALLFIIGKIAYWAILNGGQLAMHKDSEEGEIAKKIAKEILSQVNTR